jgi:phage tail-like protein
VTRGAVLDYATPWPLIEALPGLYQEDDLTRRLTSAFDDLLAPALGSIDNFVAYLDPALTPDDFLEWLAGWVGVLLDETWPVDRRRAFVGVAGQLYRMRGTREGLLRHVRLFTGGEVEIVDSGGAAWSTTSGSAPPGTADFSVTVRVKPTKKDKVNKIKLDALVAAAKPAHVVHSVEIVEAG